MLCPHIGKDAASTAKALEKAFGTSDADGCWLLSLVASDSTAPWSMTYYGKVLDGFARRPVTFFVVQKSKEMRSTQTTKMRT